MGCSLSARSAPPDDVLAPARQSLAQRLTRADSALYRAYRMNGAADGCAALGSAQHVEWAARTAQTQKNQDRYLVLAQGGSAALSVGIFDGHSLHSTQSGQAHAEAAARHLSTDLFKRLRPAGLLGATPASPPSEALVDAASASFAAHQARCVVRYKRDVEAHVVEAKRKIEAELGEEVPMELPQEGGTTATVLLLHPGGVLSAWVGDSRALLVLEEEEAAADCAADGAEPKPAGRPVRAEALTADHSTADQEEMARVLRAGGRTGKDGMSGHVHVRGSEGSLKVTRSLGDSPFHSDAAGEGAVVSAVPGVRHVALSGAARFAVVASDGVWDHLSNQQVADIAWAAMREWEASGGPSGRASSASGPPLPTKSSSFGLLNGGGAAAKPAPLGSRHSRSAPSLLRSLSGSSKYTDSGSTGRASGRAAQPGAAGAACEAVLAHIERGQAAGALDSYTDDRSICVVLLAPRDQLLA